MKIWPALLVLLAALPAQADTLRIGSKRFTESYILGEVLRRAVESKAPVEHRPGLGNTGIVFAALKTGSIDVYPEYTGTIAREILKLDDRPALERLNRALAPQGLGVAVRLGFNNTYALAMREDRAGALDIRTISDLAKHPGLRLGLSQEFIGRADGWPGLKAAYRLPFATPTGLDHGLAYEAIAAGKIEVMDIYSTDAKIERYKLRVLEDDRNYFPRYDAVLLYRLDLPRRFPEAWRALEKLEGKIDERRMIRMNAAAELEGKSFAEAAALLDSDSKPQSAARRNFWGALFGPDFWRLTGEHLLLVFVSLAASIVLGVPLGVAAAKLPRAEQVILGRRRREVAEGRASHPRRGGCDPDDSVARALRVPHRARRHDWHLARADRSVSLRAAAYRTQYLRGTDRHPPRHAAGGNGARPVDARPDAAHRSAARAAFHPGGCQYLRRHQRRHGDHRGVHRRWWLRRAHRLGAGVERQRHAARGSNPRRRARAHRAGRVRDRRAAIRLDGAGAESCVIPVLPSTGSQLSSTPGGSN